MSMRFTHGSTCYCLKCIGQVSGPRKNLSLEPQTETLTCPWGHSGSAVNGCDQNANIMVSAGELYCAAHADWILSGSLEPVFDPTDS